MQRKSTKLIAQLEQENQKASVIQQADKEKEAQNQLTKLKIKATAFESVHGSGSRLFGEISKEQLGVGKKKRHSSGSSLGSINETSEEKFTTALPFDKSKPKSKTKKRFSLGVISEASSLAPICEETPKPQSPRGA